MANLFAGDSDVSDTESSFKTNNNYATNYNSWRQKEEYNKLKTKYGEHSLDPKHDSDESDSSSDDEDVEISEKLEVDFFKTLSRLMTKDPKIYDASIKFFDDTPIDIKSKKKEKVERMFLKDYERKLLLERGGIVSDSENDEETDNPRSRSPTYIEEQRRLKENLQKVAENIEDDNESEWGGMFTARSKSKQEAEIEESDYKKWLMGHKQHLNDLDTENNLIPLKEYWSDPKLDRGEKFLRDYILNNRFLEKTNPDHVPTYDEIVHDSDEGLSEDEANLTKQEHFEHKYNYRFEEPDQDFIKRYPRTMESSLRRTDDRRKLKRAEVKERKIKEKEEKFEDIRKMKELKRKEIHERMEKLREVTGNTKVSFEEIDLDEDFDPEAHDKKMQQLFNNEFYQGEESDQKPEFPDLDEELEIERWDNWERNNEELEENVHCEDEDFNMDCDFNPQKSTQEELLENSKGGRKKRKRKSNFAKAISQVKPIFDPKDKSYEQYLDEYYKLDCEDVIGDIPCRFKYRTVVPNSFGLTVDEILNAKDRELNKWCSIKKAVQFRPDHIERYDVIAYSNKAQNEALKRKILPSLFETEEDHKEETKEILGENKPKSLKGKKNIKTAKKGQFSTEMSETSKSTDQKDKTAMSTNNQPNKDIQSLNEKQVNETVDVSESNLTSKNEKKKVKVVKSNKSNKTKKSNLNGVSVNSKKSLDKKKRKVGKPNKGGNTTEDVGISDARLKAFGIKPKQFKNKIKFGAK